MCHIQTPPSPRKYDYHSVLVNGYYQPLSKDKPTYLYLYDPYDITRVFVTWEKVHDSLEKSCGTIFINLLGLCFDHTDLISRYKRNFSEESIAKARKKILANLPGKNKKEKLAWLFS